MLGGRQVTGPVLLMRDLPVSVRRFGTDANTISRFWIELNTPPDTILQREVGLTLVMYVRSFVARADPPNDIESAGLLVKPTR